jgi:hypothetical protein
VGLWGRWMGPNQKCAKHAAQSLNPLSFRSWRLQTVRLSLSQPLTTDCARNNSPKPLWCIKYCGGRKHAVFALLSLRFHTPHHFPEKMFRCMGSGRRCSVYGSAVQTMDRAAGDGAITSQVPKSQPAVYPTQVESRGGGGT